MKVYEKTLSLIVDDYNQKYSRDIHYFVIMFFLVFCFFISGFDFLLLYFAYILSFNILKNSKQYDFQIKIIKNSDM